MNRKLTTILAAIMASLLAIGGAAAQDTGNTGPAGDQERDHDRGDGMGHRGQRGSRGPGQMVRMLTRRLDLDESQIEQVKKIASDLRPEFEVLRETGSENRSAMRDLNEEDADYDAKLASLSASRDEIVASAAELRERMRVDIDAILTPEQREEFAAAFERGRERGRGNRHRGGAQPEA